MLVTSTLNRFRYGASIARLCFEKKLFHKRESHIQGREAGRGPKDATIKGL